MSESLIAARCSPRKHVVENGQSWCDCKALLVGPTAAGNALVVTLIDSVQADALARLAPGSSSGRTPGFDPGDAGSTPAPGTIADLIDAHYGPLLRSMD